MDEIDAFWLISRFQLGLDPTADAPEAWAFGQTDTETDAVVRSIIAGEKSIATSPASDYDGELPQSGELHIVLDSREHPRALIETTSVSVVPFADFSEEQAQADGASSLAEWQEANKADLADGDVVIEAFRVLHPTK